LGLMGIMFSFVMMVLGIFWPFSAITVPMPISWLLALFVAVPSLAVYYEVKEGFWAEVEARHKAKGGPSAPSA